MAGIIAYPMATPEMGDLLLGTEIKEEGSAHLTKNFAMDAIRVLFAQQTPIQVADTLIASSTNTNLEATAGTTDYIRLGQNVNATTADVYYIEQTGRYIFKPGLYFIKFKAQVSTVNIDGPGHLYIGKFFNGEMIDTPTMVSVPYIPGSTAYSESFWLTVENEDDFLTFGITAIELEGSQPAALACPDVNTNGWTNHSSIFTIDIQKVNLV
jgi:hypothetical protein